MLCIGEESGRAFSSSTSTNWVGGYFCPGFNSTISVDTVAHAASVAAKFILIAWWALGLALLVAAGLVYPLLSLWSKTSGLETKDWTLDSSAYLELQSPEVMEAIRWLNTAPPGIIAEAVPPAGGSYTGNAVISTHSGLPAVLGWFGHESQWRGGGELLSPRQNDLVSLFCSKDWEETRSILEQYQIRYVIVGNLEREAYRAGGNNCPAGLYEAKFQRYLEPVFQLGQTTIYEVPQFE